MAVGAAALGSLLLAVWPIVSRALALRAAETRDAALLDQAAVLEAVVILPSTGALLVAGVMVISWLYRARVNLHALGEDTAAPGPGWAIGGWFIPFANLVIPFRVTAAVARGSLGRSDRLDGLLWGWWLTWVGGTIVDGAMGLADAAAYEGLPTPAEDGVDFAAYVSYYEGELLRNLPGGLLTVAAGGLLIVLLLRVSRAQEARLTTAAGPAPTGPVMPGTAVSLPPIS